MCQSQTHVFLKESLVVEHLSANRCGFQMISLNYRTENDWKCFLLTYHREKPCLISLSTWTSEQRSHNTHQWVFRGQVGMWCKHKDPLLRQKHSQLISLWPLFSHHLQRQDKPWLGIGEKESIKGNIYSSPSWKTNRRNQISLRESLMGVMVNATKVSF